MTLRSNIRTAEWSGPAEDMPEYLKPDPLEDTARLPRLNLVPGRRVRTAKPGKALPLSGAILAEWEAWAHGDDEPMYACRRAVV